MKTAQALLDLTVLLAFTVLFDADGQTNSTPSASFKLHGTNELMTNAVTTLPDLTTIKGQMYKRFTVMRVEPDGLIITHSSGIAKVPFEELPKNIQQEYGYDPAKAAAFVAEQQSRNVKNALLRQRVQQRQTVDAINIKGLYLGMPAKEACDVYNSLFKLSGNAKCIISKDSKFIGMDYGGYGGYGYWPMKIDDENKVISIRLCQSETRTLYNTQNISEEVFKDKFVKFFNIPKNALRNVQYQKEYWDEYISPNGYTLRFRNYASTDEDARNGAVLILERTVQPRF